MANLQNKRIFYVEDDARNRAVIRILLEAAGAQIEFDRWGFAETAIPKIKAFQPDLILLDLMLPAQVSGYEVYEALQRTSSLQKVPVVAVSASDPSVEIPKAKAKGLNGFIPKPIDIDHFTNALCDILDGKQIWQSHSTQR
ncbi:MAG: response regulator [Anaerolineae bacterium]|jgi:CheY-like chemotaxis protein|nr:response regulator [Anaerolineae bacterium]